MVADLDKCLRRLAEDVLRYMAPCDHCRLQGRQILAFLAMRAGVSAGYGSQAPLLLPANRQGKKPLAFCVAQLHQHFTSTDSLYSSGSSLLLHP